MEDNGMTIPRGMASHIVGRKCGQFGRVHGDGRTRAGVGGCIRFRNDLVSVAYRPGNWGLTIR